jgi:hypothetical protein
MTLEEVFTVEFTDKVEAYVRWNDTTAILDLIETEKKESFAKGYEEGIKFEKMFGSDRTDDEL